MKGVLVPPMREPAGVAASHPSLVPPILGFEVHEVLLVRASHLVVFLLAVFIQVPVNFPPSL
jgi:hypothetical protein